MKRRLKKSNKSKSILTKLQNNKAITDDELISDKLSSLKEMFNAKQDQINSSSLKKDDVEEKPKSSTIKKASLKKRKIFLKN